MEPDYGVIIGLIAAVCTAGVLGLSYLGAYFLGHSRGRREAELDRRALDEEMMRAHDVRLAAADEAPAEARHAGLTRRARRALAPLARNPASPGACSPSSAPSR